MIVSVRWLWSFEVQAILARAGQAKAVGVPETLGRRGSNQIGENLRVNPDKRMQSESEMPKGTVHSANSCSSAAQSCHTKQRELPPDQLLKLPELDRPLNPGPKRTGTAIVP